MQSLSTENMCFIPLPEVRSRIIAAYVYVIKQNQSEVGNIDFEI